MIISCIPTDHLAGMVRAWELSKHAMDAVGADARRAATTTMTERLCKKSVGERQKPYEDLQRDSLMAAITLHPGSCKVHAAVLGVGLLWCEGKDEDDTLCSCWIETVHIWTTRVAELQPLTDFACSNPSSE